MPRIFQQMFGHFLRRIFFLHRLCISRCKTDVCWSLFYFSFLVVYALCPSERGKRFVFFDRLRNFKDKPLDVKRLEETMKATREKKMERNITPRNILMLNKKS